MIYMFCADSAFSDVDETMGFMSDKMLNYFYNVTKIVDARSSYLLTNNRLTCVPYEYKAYGQMKLYFDDLRTVPATCSAPSFSDAEKAVLKAILGETDPGATDAEKAAAMEEAKNYQNYLFNIIELCFLQKSTGGALLDVATLNALLMEEATFYGYTKNSLKLSLGTTNARIRLSDTTTPLSNQYVYQDYVEFQFHIKDGSTIAIRVFLKGTSFQENYPLTILTDVVYPCEMTYLISMPYENIQEAISGSATFSSNANSMEITDKDHTGTVVFTTKYICTSKAASYAMPFNVFYKGAVPSAARCRDFIRESILRDYPDIDEKIWQEILPYLFVDATYFIVPNFVCRGYIPEHKTKVDYGVFSLPTLTAKIQELYPNERYESYSPYAHLLTIAGSGLISYCFPESANSEDHKFLANEIPGYLAVDSTSPLFDCMDEHTKRFARCVAQAIKLAQGDLSIESSGEFSYAVIDGKRYIEFVVNYIEYYMLMQTSF